jgi:hypothetical protein
MDDEDGLSEEMVTLTRSQWQDLIRSVRSLSEANTKLVETIAYLLRDTLSAASEPAAYVADRYDLSALRRIVENGE